MDPVTLGPFGTIVLRPPGANDIDRIVEQCNDPEMIRWTTIPQPYGVADAQQWVDDVVPAQWQGDSRYNFAIADAASDEYLGGIGLSPDGPRGGLVHFGLHPAARGRGVMRTAADALADWAFGTLRYEIVQWYAKVGNWDSRRLAWRLGYRMEGTVRGFSHARGQRFDAWIGTLAADDPRTPRNPWYVPAVLTGNRCVLRPFADRDAAAVVEACTDPATRKWLDRLPEPYTEVVALEYIRSREAEHATGRGIHWAAADPVTDRCIGSFSLMTMDSAPEVGYWVHPAARRNGVATEAVALLTRYAADELGVERFVLRAAADNLGSQRVALENGFVDDDAGMQRYRLDANSAAVDVDS